MICLKCKTKAIKQKEMCSLSLIVLPLHGLFEKVVMMTFYNKEKVSVEGNTVTGKMLFVYIARSFLFIVRRKKVGAMFSRLMFLRK